MRPHRQSHSIATLLTVLGITLCGAGVAQTASSGERQQKLQQKFQAADTNHDGKLTLDEAKAGMPRVARNFDKIDVEKKGYVTLEQIQAAVAQLRR